MDFLDWCFKIMRIILYLTFLYFVFWTVTYHASARITSISESEIGPRDQYISISQPVTVCDTREHASNVFREKQDDLEGLNGKKYQLIAENNEALYDRYDHTQCHPSSNHKYKITDAIGKFGDNKITWFELSAVDEQDNPVYLIVGNLK